MKRKYFLIVVIIMCLFSSIPSLADNEIKGQSMDEEKLSRLSITHHSVRAGDKLLKYTVKAGNFLMRDEETGKFEAAVFFMAYTLDDGAGKTDLKDRPVTFAFNGGPGSASLWLHMGGLGPKRVEMSDEGFPLPQPFRYVDNPYTWLEFTDLVFIDPVSTGYSRLAPGAKPEKFHGLRQDIRSVGDFIRLYVTRSGRWLSPKYLCGESYGTTRAAGLSGYLQETHGMFLQGIVMVSPVLSFQTVQFGPGNDLPYVLFVPAYTAAALYHKRLPGRNPENFKATLEEVEEWALCRYLPALAKGNKLAPDERNAVIDKLALYTGLSRSDIEAADLRVDMLDFARGLLRDKGETVGRLDSRFTSKSPYSRERRLEDDPGYSAIQGPYVAAVNFYIREELKYIDDSPYRPMARQVSPWDWGKGNGYVNEAETLRKAINKNNGLKVFVAAGYYDLATPYFATGYTAAHLGLPSSLAGNIVLKYYESGHMIYIRKASLVKLRDDVREFYGQN